MIRLLVTVLVNLATAALGLLVASWVFDDVTLTWSGFLVAVVVFTVAQAILTPFVLSMARKYAPGLLGAIGLVSTLLSLWIATLFPDGLTIRGAVTWVLATLVVWVVSALGSWLLPLWLLKNRKAGNAAA